MPKAARQARQTVLRPLGLRTTPNPYGQFPAGALATALNCVLRRPGELEAAPSFTNFTSANSTVNPDETVRLLMPLDAGHVYCFTHTAGDVWSVAEGVTGSVPTLCSIPTGISTTSLFSQTRVSATRSRDRMIVNSSRGALVGDFKAPSSGTERALRYAGLPQPGLDVDNIHFTAGSAIPNQVMVAYGAVITREFSDGYILKSVPSIYIKIWNPTSSGTDEQVVMKVDWNVNSSVKVGDYIELYRTDGLLTTSLNADPGNTFKLVYRYQLLAADITAGFILITDNQLMVAPFYSTVGRELYTNPYQEGSTNANRQPDVCGAMATFKGFTFYGNLTERPQLVLNVPGGINDTVVNLSTARATTGVGGRGASGTITSGSATITAIAAAALAGVVPGQVYSGINFPANTKVLSVGATSITMTANATSNGTGWVTLDVLEINGSQYVFGSARVLVGGNKEFEVTSNQTIGFNTGIDLLGLEMTLEPSLPSGATPSSALPLTVTVRGTNGQNYSPQIPSLTSTVKTIQSVTTPNLLRWSKDSEPEHVPSVNETRVGSGQIIAMVGTKDALWIACTDGIYRLSGDAGVWRLDIIAPGCVLCGPRCMVNMREVAYGYTSLGFGAITDSGFVPISQSVVREALPGPPFSETGNIVVGRNDAEGEVLISTSPTTNSQIYVYNTLTNAFTSIYDAAHNFLDVTAFAWQENPASGFQALLWGKSEPGFAPVYFQWNSAAVHLDMSIQFLPFFAEDASVMKQWVDVTYMFIKESAGYTLSATLAGSAAGSGVIAAQGGTESYATFGVSRRFAISQKISPGFNIGSITTNRVLLYGVSCRYVPLTFQQGVRQ